MPRYVFRISAGNDLADETQVDLEGQDAVRATAVQTAGEALRDLRTTFWNVGCWEMTVLDDTGAEILSIEISGRATSAKDGSSTPH